jgi:uncharacterized protein YyaL (SSP411 family)
MNRLGSERSLYLRQHADNPVHWHPWDDQALQEARDRDCPILLSIGYSACHWCHVMAHESFEDEDTARLMNRYFVNLKVDREERPDLDRIYQLSHQLLTGRGGGWPLTVFLDPDDLTAFFAGTYFPPERRYGMPAFRDVLVTLKEWFGSNRQEVRDQGGKLVAALESVASPGAEGDGEIDGGSAQALLQEAARQVMARHDGANGGYGAAPKFPQAPLLGAVAGLGSVEAGDSLHDNLRFTLGRMARSGLRDHLDGGFFRYCVDEHWTIPHFEKMLYDNAMLLPLYAEGARRWNDDGMARAAEGIAAWLESVMQRPGGGYAASIDADAEGVEGGYHVWTREEVESALGEDCRQCFLLAYGLDLAPNFEARTWHLVRHVTTPELSRSLGQPEAAIEALLEKARRSLRRVRDQRVPPVLDGKGLTSWNALLAGGLLRAGRALDRTDWVDRAVDILAFVERALWTGSSLMAVQHGEQARYPAYLDDYAFLLRALLLSLQARWDKGRLAFAMAVADALLERFEDPDHGAFYFTDASVDVPVCRPLGFQDDATPAGNAVAIIALNRLGHLLGEGRYLGAAERCLRRGMPHLRESPLACASLLTALQDSVTARRHLVVAGSDEAEIEAIERWARGLDRLDCYAIGIADEPLPGLLAGYRAKGPLTAWLCQGTQCLPPATSLGELEQQFELGFGPTAATG